jgi:hypothetical protein
MTVSTITVRLKTTLKVKETSTKYKSLGTGCTSGWMQ